MNKRIEVYSNDVKIKFECYFKSITHRNFDRIYSVKINDGIYFIEGDKYCMLKLLLNTNASHDSCGIQLVEWKNNYWEETKIILVEYDNNKIIFHGEKNLGI